jgi:hypothetical protein
LAYRRGGFLQEEERKIRAWNQLALKLNDPGRKVLGEPDSDSNSGSGCRGSISPVRTSFPGTMIYRKNKYTGRTPF